MSVPMSSTTTAASSELRGSRGIVFSFVVEQCSKCEPPWRKSRRQVRLKISMSRVRALRLRCKSAIHGRGTDSATGSGMRNSTSPWSSSPSGMTWPWTWRSRQRSRPLAPYGRRRTTLAVPSTRTSTKLWKKGARLKSNAEARSSGEDGQAASRFTQNQIGHFHHGVWLSSLAMTASVRG